MKTAFSPTSLADRPLSLLVLLILLGWTMPAQAESPLEVATRLQERYDSIVSLRFDFSQSSTGQLGGRPKRGRGQAFFVKGMSNGRQSARMRWNYSAPKRQVLINDGVHFSMYFAALSQMIVTPAKGLEQDLTSSFFIGSGNLLRDFIILAPDSDQDSPPQTTTIKLLPRTNQSQIAFLHLRIDPASLIRRIEIVDQFDTRTVLDFSKIQVDTLDPQDLTLMAKLFQFTPPEGTEIIER